MTACIIKLSRCSIFSGASLQSSCVGCKRKLACIHTSISIETTFPTIGRYIENAGVTKLLQSISSQNQTLQKRARYRCIYGRSFVDWKQWPPRSHQHRAWKRTAWQQAGGQVRNGTERRYHQKWKTNEPTEKAHPEHTNICVIAQISSSSQNTYIKCTSVQLQAQFFDAISVSAVCSEKTFKAYFDS